MDSNHRPADYETPSGSKNARNLNNFAKQGCRMRQIAALGRNPGATEIQPSTGSPAVAYLSHPLSRDSGSDSPRRYDASPADGRRRTTDRSSMDSPSNLRTTTRGFLLPYRFGAHKWEDYLLDTQTLIYAGAKGQIDATTRLRLVAEQGNAVQAELLSSFQAYADRAGVAWDRISGQLDTISDTLASGFTSLNDTLRFHGELLKSIAGQLDRVVFALEKRLDTEAKELFENASSLMGRQLYPEALADFKAAEAKRPVNPILHLHLAQLHYAVSDPAVPFSFEAAEHHISLAIRYARAMLRDLGPSGSKIDDLIHRTAADIAFRKGGDATHIGDGPKAHAELRRALGFLGAIEEPSPSSRFFRARVETLLGNEAAALAEIRSLADFTRAWVARSLLEPDLAAIAADVGHLQELLLKEPGPHTQTVRGAAARAEEFAGKIRAVDFDDRRCLGLREVSHSAVAKFDAGGITAPEAVYAIQRRIDAVRGALLTELEAAIEEGVAAETQHARRATEVTRRSGSQEKDGSWNVFGPVSVAAFLVALVVGLVSWSQVVFWVTFVVLVVAVMTKLLSDDQKVLEELRTEANQVETLRRQARERIDDCTARVRLLKDAEMSLDIAEPMPEAAGAGRVAVGGMEDVPIGVLQALDRGQTVLAIRRFREATGAGLKEAKEFVDELRRSQDE